MYGIDNEKMAELLSNFCHYVNDEMDLDLDPAEIESIVDEWLELNEEDLEGLAELADKDPEGLAFLD